MEEQENVVPTINGTEINIGNDTVNPVANSDASASFVADLGATPNSSGTDTETTDTWKHSALPVKVGFWAKFKEFLFQDIKVELTPKQQKVEDEINAFLFKEITFGKKKKD